MKFRDFMKAIISTLLLTLSVVTVNDNYKVVNAETETPTVSWSRVTSVDTLTAGGTFIIGYEATAKSGTIVPMQNTGTATTSAAGYLYSGTANGSAGNGTITMSSVTDTSKYEVTIASSTSVTGAITIKANGNYVGNTNTSNNLKLFTSESETTAFTPTVGTNDVFTLKIDANAKYHTLQYNTGSPRFAVYGATQKNVVIYKKIVAVFSLSFEANTDSYTGSMETLKNQSKVTIPNCSFTNSSGAEFSHWNTKDDDTGTSYNVGDSITLSKDTTLYAQWLKNPYHVIFKYNDTKSTEIIIPNEKESVVSEPTDKEVGSEYVIGWCTDTDKTINYNFDTLLSTLVLTNYTLTLYAKTGPYPLNYNFVQDNVYKVSGEVTAQESNNAFYLQDEYGAVYLYGAQDYLTSDNVGNTIEITGTYTLYKNMREFKSITAVSVISDDNTVSVTRVHEVNNDNAAKLVSLNGIKLSNVTINGKSYTASVVGNTSYSLQGSTNYISEENASELLQSGKYLDIEGAIYRSNSELKINLTSVKIATSYLTVTFNANGGTLDDSSLQTQSVWPGDTISSPTATNENLEFQGWYTDEGLTNKWDFSNPITSELEFKAKWGSSITDYEVLLSKTSVRSNLAFRYREIFDSYTDTLDCSKFVATSTTYKDFTDVSVDTSSAKYTGNSSKSKNNEIQFRSSDNSGIVSTTSGGYARKISITWGNGNDSSRKVDIYASNTAFTSSANLYADLQPLGSLQTGEEGSTSVLNISKDYQYIGIRSHSGALYIKSISIVWDDPNVTYSNSDFRMMLGIEDDFFTNAAKLTNVDDYGIFVSNGTTDEYLLSDSANKATYSKIADDNENLYNHDDTYNISYVILDLGDIFENEDRAEMSFYTRAYITVGDKTYYSEWQEFIVLAMLEEYNEMDDYKDLVSECYEYLKSLLTPAA